MSQAGSTDGPAYASRAARQPGEHRRLLEQGVGRARSAAHARPSSRTGAPALAGRRVTRAVASSSVSRQTTQGALARRGFVDAAAAVRILSEWDDEREYLLDLVADAADPDLALAGLDRIAEVVPGSDRSAGRLAGSWPGTWSGSWATASRWVGT